MSRSSRPYQPLRGGTGHRPVPSSEAAFLPYKPFIGDVVASLRDTDRDEVVRGYFGSLFELLIREGLVRVRLRPGTVVEAIESE